MRPMHFGRSDGPLYGFFDPGAPPRRRKAVLILNPWGWEAIRAHRSLRTLASRLSLSGFDVLRFDYSGTGDSYGALSNVTVEGWLTDAEYALEELIAMAGLGSASLVGLRLGGLVASELAVRRGQEVNELVLWESPSSGMEFLEWSAATPEAEARAFPLPAAFQRAVTGLELSRLDGFRRNVMVISRDPSPVGLPRSRSVEHVHVPDDGPRSWVEHQDDGAGAVPGTLIDQIVDWLQA